MAGGRRSAQVVLGLVVDVQHGGDDDEAVRVSQPQSGRLLLAVRSRVEDDHIRLDVRGQRQGPFGVGHADHGAAGVVEVGGERSELLGSSLTMRAVGEWVPSVQAVPAAG